MAKPSINRAPRISHRVKVKVYIDDKVETCQMLNFSETGMFILLNTEASKLVITGDTVNVQTCEFEGAPIVAAEVVRKTDEGIGIRFTV